MTSAVSGKDGKFWEVLKDFTAISYAYPLNMLTINKDYWDSLTGAQQKAMLKAASEVEEHQWNASRTSNEESLKILAENGIRIAQPSPELAAALDENAAEMLAEFKKMAKNRSLKALAGIDK